MQIDILKYQSQLVKAFAKVLAFWKTVPVGSSRAAVTILTMPRSIRQADCSETLHYEEMSKLSGFYKSTSTISSVKDGANITDIKKKKIDGRYFSGRPLIQKLDLRQ